MLMREQLLMVASNSFPRILQSCSNDYRARCSCPSRGALALQSELITPWHSVHSNINDETLW